MFNERTLFRMFSLFSLLFFAAVGVRLFFLQVVQHDFYGRIADTQSSTQVVFTKDRGLILDSEGRPLAQNKKVASLYTFGKNIDDPDQFIKALKANGITVNSSVRNVIEKKSGFVWLARHIDIAKAEKIQVAVPNVSYRLEDSRFYPEGKMLSGLLGYTGVDNQGLEGLEYFADHVLRGQIVPVSTVKDSRGKLILFDDGAFKMRADSAVYLTMNLQMQAVAEQILKEDLAQFGARRAIAVAMDVQTGDIVAAAYAKDPKFKDELEGKNFISAYLFEPGSIFKAVTFAHLIEADLYRPDHKVNTSKAVELYGHRITDVGNYSSLSQKEVFTKSSNIGTVQLASRADKESFYKFMSGCGFGRKLNIEGMVEESGLLREPKKWSGLSQASLSIGQEIMVTPIQMVRFYAAIANSGVAAKPNVVQRYNTGGGVYYPAKSYERIMTEKTASVLMEMMSETVKTGTGSRAKTPVMTVGGKTGTGQMMDPKTKLYSKTDYVASFAGIFPVENPKVAMVVIYEAPRSSIYGGSTGAVTFRRLAEQIAFFYNLGGDNTKVKTVIAGGGPEAADAYASR